MGRLTVGLARWTFDLEGQPVRMAAVAKADPENYLRLSRQRDARVRLRVWVSGTVAVLSAAGPWWLLARLWRSGLLPGWRWRCWAGLVPRRTGR